MSDMSLSNLRKVNWSAGKKDWCCQHQKRGCAAVPVKPALYDCSAGTGGNRIGWKFEVDATVDGGKITAPAGMLLKHAKTL